MARLVVVIVRNLHCHNSLLNGVDVRMARSAAGLLGEISPTATMATVRLQVSRRLSLLY